MPVWFLACAIGFLLIVPIHFWSVEHGKLQRKYGKKKGVKIGKILGTFSGWMELVFLFLFWIAPQPRFVIPIFSSLSITLPFVNFSVPILHLVIALPLMLFGGWIAIKGVRAMSSEVGFGVADTHSKPSEIVRSWPYSVVRHPQYLGAVLAYMGGSILLSASYALLFTPVYVLCNYLISWKEEKELVKELGKEYKNYQKKVPMFIPRFGKG